MWQSIIKLKLVFLLALALSGCVMMSSHPAEVKLEGIEFIRANPFEQRFVLNIKIKNTSSKSLFLRNLDYKIYLNGLVIAKGEQFVWREIAGFATDQLEIVVTTNIWHQLKPIISSIKEYQAINYYLAGKLTSGNLLYQQVSYINYSGTLTPDQLPKDKIDKLLKKIPSGLKI